MNFHGKRATVMGLGHFGGGVGVTRWLARKGAVVTVTDLADEKTLADSLAALDGEPVAKLHLGGHREDDFREVDLVVVNPAVRPGNPFVEIARRSGARLSSEIELFMRSTPAPIVGVTGSNGKSTTAAMTAAILRAEGQNVWLGGNIGHSLLGELDQIGPHDVVVLELSSFQLWHLAPETPMPHVAVVTGCSPNHLDWHGSYEHYVSAKQRILTGQNASGRAVINTYDREVRQWGSLVRGNRLTPTDLETIPPLDVPGEHNRINAALAAAAARASGCGESAVEQGLRSFGPLPQRLQQVAIIEGRTFYNDSASTTPESTIAALRSLDQPVWLLAGGRDKGCDFEQLVAAIVDDARGAAFFGPVGPQLRNMVASRAAEFPCVATENFDEAFAFCHESSRPGEAVVLSPACATGDRFRNYRARGERFVELVHSLSKRLGH